jgi:hypothetical protein
VACIHLAPDKIFHMAHQPADGRAQHMEDVEVSVVDA